MPFPISFAGSLSHIVSLYIHGNDCEVLLLFFFDLRLFFVLDLVFFCFLSDLEFLLFFYNFKYIFIFIKLEGNT